MSPTPLPYRSLLYVPANVERFVARAHTRGADAIQLDLEDSIAESDKAAARRALPAAARTIRQNGGPDLFVRINAPLRLAVPDLEAAIGPDITGITLPKLRSATHLQLLDELVTELEAAAGLPPGHTRFIGLIEDPASLTRAASIATATPRLAALALGSEDFATAIGTEPDEDVLQLPKQTLLLATRAAGLTPLGLLGSLANFNDPTHLRRMAERSARFGFTGASCINPAQIPILNTAFTPTDAQIDWATRILTTAQSTPQGALQIDGQMIDRPIIQRAQSLLTRARR